MLKEVMETMDKGQKEKQENIFNKQKITTKK